MTSCPGLQKDGEAALLVLQQIRNDGGNSPEGPQLQPAEAERADERGVWRQAEVRVHVCLRTEV